MTNIKPTYYGDPNMVLRLAQSEILSARAKNALRDDGIIFLADLLQKTEAGLLRIPNFGRKCLNEVTEFLKNLSDGNNQYELGEPYNNNQLFRGDLNTIRSYFGLDENQSQPKSMKGYAEKSFTSVSAYIEGDNVIYAFTLSDEFANLIRDGHIHADSNDFISTFFNHALCDSPSFIDSDGCEPKIELAYNQESPGDDMSGLLRLAHVSVLQGFLDAVNHMLPAAIASVEKDWGKRYGIQPTA